MTLTNSEARVLLALVAEHRESRKPVKSLIVLAACNAKGSHERDKTKATLASLRTRGLVSQHDDAWLPTGEGIKAAAAAKSSGLSQKQAPAASKAPAAAPAVPAESEPEVSQARAKPEPSASQTRAKPPACDVAAPIESNPPNVIRPASAEEIDAANRAVAPGAGASSTACDDQWQEERIDVIGQNGATGDHYPPPPFEGPAAPEAPPSLLPPALKRCRHCRIQFQRPDEAPIPHDCCESCHLAAVAPAPAPPAAAAAQGRKDDAEKLRMDLLFVDMPRALAEVVDVLTQGARKYAPGNWQHVPDAERRYLAAGLRHELALARGQRLDPETRCHHLAHSICCDLFRLELALREGDQ